MNDPVLLRELEKLDPTIPFRAVQGHTHHTWAKTFHSHPALYVQPHSLAEIQKLVHLARRCRQRLVVVGSGHCPNTITCTSSWMVNLDEYSEVLRVDKDKKIMTVQAGIRLGALNREAKKCGWTIPNLGSIDQQSIAGAIATGTHGSSLQHGILSQWVHSLRLVLANGEVVKCSAKQNKDLFQAALVSLGALGIVVEVEYQMAPATNIEWLQTLQSMDTILDTWEKDLWTQAEFTRVWWLPYLHRAVVWRAQKSQKKHIAPKSNWYGGAVGFHTYHILLWLSNYVPRILPAVEWFVFGMQYGFSAGTSITAVEEQRTGLLMNCLYSQFVNEWALPLSEGPGIICRLSAWLNGRESESGIPFSSEGIWVHSPIEVRVSDTSKHSGQARPFLDISYEDGPTLYLNATLYRAYDIDPPCKNRYYEAFEWLMRDVGAKPHWAKNFLTPQRSDFEEMYGDKLQSWRKVRSEVDPEGLFVGEWLRGNVLEAPAKAPLSCEEIEVSRNAWGKEGGGGVEWLGKQASIGTQGLMRRSTSSGSSQESFDQVAGAEIEESRLFESMSEDQGNPVDEKFHGKSREGAEIGFDGTKVFEKM
ncbi:putative d-arabinono- -lactone oxidase protein [Venturia nashicola]|nr:putative d-arabinono- -lactone oxidase protein [Venturia nashicola]